VSPAPRIDDTTPEAQRQLVEGWRRMAPGQKLALVLQMSASVRRLAYAGVQRRHPHASPHEQRLRLAQVLFGDELARAAYPELETLDRP
jgi:hypothetical protein